MSPENQSNAGSAQWLADPNQARAQAAAPAFEPFKAPPQDQSLGTPRQEASDARPIDEAESLLRLARQEYEKEPELQFEDVGKPDGLRLAGILKKTGLSSLVLALSALGLLVLATQALSYMSYLASLPLWGQYLGYGIGGVLVLVVLFCLGRFLLAYFKLEKSPRISLQALNALSRRSQLRQQAAGLLLESKERLVKFLEDYPVQGNGRKQGLVRLGFSPESIDLLQKNRKQLLESAQEEGCEGWLAQMDARFVCLLDQAARKRITRYAWLVGVKTAAAPTGFIDASIVLINAYRLIEDLCGIYRLRAGESAPPPSCFVYSSMPLPRPGWRNGWIRPPSI